MEALEAKTEREEAAEGAEEGGREDMHRYKFRP